MQHLPWAWVSCTDYHCGHTRAIPFTPWSIRWGVENLGATIERHFYCSRCGKRGAVFTQAGIEHLGEYSPFPANPLRTIGGRRRDGESSTGADARNKAEYLAMYTSGDPLGDFRGGPPGPATMCGKFTAMFSWREVAAFTQPLTRDDVKESDNDRVITFRVMSNLPVIIWDKQAGKRVVVPMRWGFPDSRNWKMPKPIHARSETIEVAKAFASAFRDGQRGIVIVRTFNEAPDVPGQTVQHTITPGELGAIGIAFIWRQFEITDLAGAIRACVMVTVPANKLIATLPTDRMPAVLADEDWATWLGETSGTPEDAKACLKTVEGVRWTMTKEERAAATKRKRPTVSDPDGLF